MALREVRQNYGVTQKACARKLGISRQTYSKYEKEPWLLTYEQVYILMDILDCDYKDIYLPDDVRPFNK